ERAGEEVVRVEREMMAMLLGSRPDRHNDDRIAIKALLRLGPRQGLEPYAKHADQPPMPRLRLSSAAFFTSPRRGEVGAKRRVRGRATSAEHAGRPLTRRALRVDLSPAGRGKTRARGASLMTSRSPCRPSHAPRAAPWRRASPRARSGADAARA